LMRKVTDLMLAGVTRYLEEVGPYIDVLVAGDDLGTDSSLMMSPQVYREMIKPYHGELLAAIKQKTKAKIFFHSDGNVYPLIGDLIEVGVDILNPVQVSAGDMGDTARLKREFGKNISFCGAIDTQTVLPYGTPEEVRAEVRGRIKDLAPGGGYIVATVHCIQPDVPPENVLAMCDEVLVSGKYPLLSRPAGT
jgi:uroporphyrinogen decarboxylase